MGGDPGLRRSSWWEKGLLTFKGKVSLRSPKSVCSLHTSYCWLTLSSGHSSCLPGTKWCFWSVSLLKYASQVHITSRSCLSHLLLYRCSKSYKNRTVFSRDKLVWEKDVFGTFYRYNKLMGSTGLIGTYKLSMNREVGRGFASKKQGGQPLEQEVM